MSKSPPALGIIEIRRDTPMRGKQRTGPKSDSKASSLAGRPGMTAGRPVNALTCPNILDNGHPAGNAPG